MSPHFFKNPLLNIIHFWLQKIYHSPSDYGNRKRIKKFGQKVWKGCKHSIIAKKCCSIPNRDMKTSVSNSEVIFIDGGVGKFF